MALTNSQLIALQLESIRPRIIEILNAPVPQWIKDYRDYRTFEERYVKPEPVQLELEGIEHPPEPYEDEEDWDY